MKNVPKKIYLQLGDDVRANKKLDFNSLNEVTWHKEKINKNDIEYVSNEYVLFLKKMLQEAIVEIVLEGSATSNVKTIYQKISARVKNKSQWK